MKSKKLIQQLDAWFCDRERRERQERAALEDLLGRLATKQAKLEAELDAEGDGERAAKLGKKLALVRAQREKGERALGAEPTRE